MRDLEEEEETAVEVEEMPLPWRRCDGDGEGWESLGFGEEENEGALLDEDKDT